MRDTLAKKMEEMIACLPYGAVLAVADFEKVAQPKTVSKMLTRFAEDGTIRKVMRSVFWKPDGVHLSPEPNEVAKALARENRWETAPTGETALHLFGIKEKKPSVWTYITTGSCRKYRYDGNEILFSHTSGQPIHTMSEKTRLFVQCLRAYGEERLSDDVLGKLRKKLTDHEWKNVMAETRETSAWIKKILHKMIDLRPLAVK